MAFNDGLALTRDIKSINHALTWKDGFSVSYAKGRDKVILPFHTISDERQNPIKDLESRAFHYENILIPTPAESFVEDRTRYKKSLDIWTDSKTSQNQSRSIHMFPAVSYVSKAGDRSALLIFFSPLFLKEATAFVIQEDQSRIYQKPGLSISTRSKREQMKVAMKEALAHAQSTEGKTSVIIESANAFAADVRTQMISSFTELRSASALVQNEKPPVWGKEGSNGQFKSTRLVIQKNSFFEMYLNFEESRVEEAIGIPGGMIMENSYIKGTPKLSGRYNAVFKLSNGGSIDALIIVPDLPRQL